MRFWKGFVDVYNSETMGATVAIYLGVWVCAAILWAIIESIARDMKP